jgi:streptomycin 6-kinase
MREEAIAQRVAAEWGVRLGERLAGATCSLVLAASDEAGRDLVLKVPEEIAEEGKSLPTLYAFSEHGGVPVLRADRETGAVLLPRLRPGYTLAEAGLTDLAAVDVCAEAILRLRAAKAEGGLPLEPWFAELDPTQDALGRDAAEVARWLFATTENPIVVHGDLHHFNLLAHGDGWVVIDPKGYRADPAYEIAAFMRNPYPSIIDTAMVRQRLRRFAERLGDPPERLWGWSFAQIVLDSQGDVPPGPFQRHCRPIAEALAECRDEFWRGTTRV